MMEALLAPLRRLPEYRALLEEVENGAGVVSLHGLGPVHRAHLAAALCADLPGRVFCALHRDEEAARVFCRDFETLTELPAALLPARDFAFHQLEGVSREYEQKRIGAFGAMADGCRMLSAPAEAMMLRTLTPAQLRRGTLTLSMNTRQDPTALAAQLCDAGYARCEQVEGPGQFALRGGILDVFPAGAEAPVRAEFFGDDVDSLGVFDPMTQRRSRAVAEVRLLPAREALPRLAEGGADGLCAQLEKLAARKNCPAALRKTLLDDLDRLRDGLDLAAADRYLPLISPDFASGFSHLPAGTVCLLCDSAAVLESARGLAHRQAEDVAALLESGVLAPSKSGWNLDESQFRAQLTRCVLLDSFLNSSGPAPTRLLSLEAKQLPSYGGSLETAQRDLEDYLALGYTLFALAGGKTRAQNLRALLEQNGLPCVSDARQAGPGRVCVLPEALSAGFEYPALRLAAVCEGLTGARPQRARKRAGRKDHLQSFSDLHPGDLVVHEHHGVGRFVGVERIQVDKVWRDYMKIAYAGSDFVFVPATGLDLVSKYIGAAEPNAVKLSKLGGAGWQKAKARAKKSAEDLAEKLIAPMDRLVCGDVGFGKTEVAIRAAFKAVQDGKQVAVLVPTTLLASSTSQTFIRPLRRLPVRVEVLSRFLTRSQSRKVRRPRDRRGRRRHRHPPAAVGRTSSSRTSACWSSTRSSASASPTRSDQAAEANVDVLTLTATPIPRTLEMSLTGIRDLSLLRRRPPSRQPILTYVGEYDERAVAEPSAASCCARARCSSCTTACDIDRQAAGSCASLVPEARIAVAHGQMDEGSAGAGRGRLLGGPLRRAGLHHHHRVRHRHAHRQHPGRRARRPPGPRPAAPAARPRRPQRSGPTPTCSTRPDRALSEEAYERLKTIGEATELGSGFRIAMRDLEIRGAGNLLGTVARAATSPPSATTSTARWSTRPWAR
jgi:transcription-repair coupling factor (superfamily II helicase)